MTTIALRRIVVAVFMTVLGSSSCDNNAEKQGDLLVRITAGGKALSNYVFIAVKDSGTVEKISCPGKPKSGVLFCEENGTLIVDAQTVSEITIKARGHHFLTTSVHLQNSKKNGDIFEINANIKALESYETTDSYRTGFDLDSGEDHFKQMAYTIDTELGPAHTVKFYMRHLDTSPKIYFMNTQQQPLHYPFVKNILKLPISLIEYEMETYYTPNRTAMAGSLVYYPTVVAHSAAFADTVAAPVTLTFFPSDTLSPEQAMSAHRLIEERMGFLQFSMNEKRLVYLPASTDKESELLQDTVSFKKGDALWMKKVELYGNTSFQIMNAGESYGKLRAMSAKALEKEVVSFSDILILTELPNSLPVVGGTITEQVQTPLAHVNVAAMARGTPNISLVNASNDEKVASLIGEYVHFVVANGGFVLEKATLAEVTAFWESKQKEFMTPESDLNFRNLAQFDDIGFDDAHRVGTKAANVAELGQLIGERAPYGFAVPFYFYDKFMTGSIVTEALCLAANDDCRQEQRDVTICQTAYQICVDASEALSLRDYIAQITQRDDFRSDTILREALLDGIRHHIRSIPVDTQFAEELDKKISELFGNTKVRLRSSTNAEDLEFFSGAGLYKSVSGYGSGEEKRASKQIRKVWASVWSFKAFEERAYWNIDHLSVYMGVLVHQAFPDEAANGVLVTQNLADPLVAGMYVNVQQGEISVTNPENGATPEIFYIAPAIRTRVGPTLLAYSSLSLNEPILSTAEITQLYDTAVKIQKHFAALYDISAWEAATFEMEFKFHGPDRDFYIKQVRPFVD